MLLVEKCSILDSRYSILDAGFSILDSGCWMLDTGRSMLAACALKGRKWGKLTAVLPILTPNSERQACE